MESGQRACIITYGCQMNKYDSDVIAGILKREGYLLEDDPQAVDLVLVNTCSVRAHAENRALNMVKYLVSLKIKRPKMKVGVCGCMAERLGSELFKKGVDVVLGPSDIKELPSILKLLNQGKTNLLAIGGIRDPHQEGLPISSRDLSSFLPVCFGCNGVCSYCIVPFVRGKQKSRKMEEVVNEVKRLLNNGVREITLLGQQVNAYGEDFPGGMDLSRLLWEINRIDTPFWVRFITAHPKKMKEDLIYAMASLKKVCEHLHLPLQAGSDKILQRMRRGYTFENYLKVVETIRGVIPDLAITTDIIVGFPGEDEMDFKKTLVALEEIRFDGAFIFKYSPRPKTKASSFIDDVQDEVKKARLSELVELQGKITEEKNRELIGKVEEVLVFERNPKGKGVLGRTRTNKTVVFDGEDEIIGEFVKVRITDAGRWHLKGRRFEDAT